MTRIGYLYIQDLTTSEKIAVGMYLETIDSNGLVSQMIRYSPERTQEAFDILRIGEWKSEELFDCYVKAAEAKSMNFYDQYYKYSYNLLAWSEPNPVCISKGRTPEIVFDELYNRNILKLHKS